jgi:hypothetical protein
MRFGKEDLQIVFECEVKVCLENEVEFSSFFKLLELKTSLRVLLKLFSFVVELKRKIYLNLVENSGQY